MPAEPDPRPLLEWNHAPATAFIACSNLNQALAMPASSRLNTVTEPARTLPVYGEFDVVVIGGGPAGLAASFSAAKRGARTLLI